MLTKAKSAFLSTLTHTITYNSWPFYPKFDTAFILDPKCINVQILSISRYHGNKILNAHTHAQMNRGITASHHQRTGWRKKPWTSRLTAYTMKTE